MDDALFSIFIELTYTAICACESVCTQWKGVANKPYLWNIVRNKLWEGKYVSNRIRALCNPKTALKESIRDAKRTYITLDELCRFEWSFRFKGTAGVAWTIQDPWWQGQTALKFKFLKEGSIELVGNNKKLNQGNSQKRWRFGEDPVQGSIVRLGQYPSYHFSRNPDTWAFIMENCWDLWYSEPLKKRNMSKSIVELSEEDAALSISVKDQMSEVMSYNNNMDALDVMEIVDYRDLLDNIDMDMMLIDF